MGEKTGIEWCDHTFNPWIGCTKVSAGCAYCYAQTQNLQYRWVDYWGPGVRKRTSPDYWSKPLKWAKAIWHQCVQCGHRAGLKPGQGELMPVCPECAAEHTMQPTRARVFCASLADWLDVDAEPEWRLDLARLIFDTPELDWLLLTKRITTREDILDECGFAAGPNWWLGVTAEDQTNWDQRVPALLERHPAPVRFVSVEPMLGPIDLRGLRPDWIICGGETGHAARRMNAEWVTSLRDQCAAAGIPFFFKRWGGRDKVHVRKPEIDGVMHRAFPEPNSALIPA